jgi:hypothetical protein
MNPKRYLNRIRGWFPKEPSMPRDKLKMAETKVSKTKPWWWKFWPLIAISCIILIVTQAILYLLAYIELFTLFGGVLVLLTIPLSYAIEYIQTRYRQSKSVELMNRIAFILGPACLAIGGALFSSAFIALATGGASANYLGPWGTIIIMFVVAPIIGASIGYWIGKRRDFMPFV